MDDPAGRRGSIAAIKGFAARVIAKDYFGQKNKVESKDSAATDDDATAPSDEDLMDESNGGIQLEAHPTHSGFIRANGTTHGSVDFQKVIREKRALLRSSSSADTVLTIVRSKFQSALLIIYSISNLDRTITALENI
jgi:hypothetical protein